MPIDLNKYLNENLDRPKVTDEEVYDYDDSLYHHNDTKDNFDEERMRGD